MSAWRKAVVGTDGSLTASRAVQRAVDIAEVLGARLLVVYVGDPDSGRPVLDSVAAEYGEQVELDLRVLSGDPADALLRLAHEEAADVIIVGNKGMSGAKRFLLGSVPNKVSHKARCDVVVVHTTSSDA